MHNVQVHHPDLVAQAAGHMNRDDWSGHLGIDPEDVPRRVESAVVMAAEPNRSAASGITAHQTLTKAIVSLLVVYCLHQFWFGNAS